MRVAIVGTGAIAPVHARLVHELGGEIVAVVGRTPGAARTAGLGPAFPTLPDALTQARPDVVHVCTPAEGHAEIAIQALRAGAHVLCEKPLAASHDEAQRMVDAAERAGRVGATAYTYRGYPLVQELRERVCAGQYGPLRRVAGQYLSADAVDPTTYPRQVTPGTLPSYALLDLGVHLLDLVEHVSGSRIVELCCLLATHQGRRTWTGAPGQGPQPAGGAADGVDVTVDDQADVLLRLDGGAQGSLCVSAVSPGHPNSLRLELDGSTGGADWEQPTPNVLRERGSEGVLLRERDPRRFSVVPAPLASPPAGHPEGYADAFRNVVAAAWAGMRGEPVAFPSFADGARGVELVEAALASAGAGRPSAV